jgi:hypothetical protein
MSIRNIALVAAILIATGFAANSALAGAVDVQVLPDGSVMAVNVEGVSEFCIDPQDRRTCRLLKNHCDFIVANPHTRQISEPEPITSEAILAYGGPDSLPLLQDNSELVKSFKFGENECNLTQTAKALIQNDRPDNDPDPQPGSPN